MDGLDLLKLIPEAELRKYCDYAPFENNQPGFNVKRNYPENIPYKSPVGLDGTQDSVCMVRLVLGDIQSNGDFFYRMTTSLFSYSEYFHGESLESAPSREKIIRSKFNRKPLDFMYSEPSMLFCPSNGMFAFDGKLFTLSDLLDRAFENHSNSSKLWNISRFKYILLVTLSGVAVRILDKLLPLFMWILEGFGRKFENFNYVEYIWGLASPTEMYEKPENNFSLLGLKISKNGLTIFSSISVMGYCYAKILDSKISFVSEVFSSPFLTVIFAVVGFAIIDDLIPDVICHMFIFGIKTRQRLRWIDADGYNFK